MSLIDKLKQIILDAARDEELRCPSEHGLEEIEACKGGNSAEKCRWCWAAAIEKAELEEDREDD